MRQLIVVLLGLLFGLVPLGMFGLTDSNLPIVLINTNGQTIVDDPKIMADLGIVWHGPGVRNAVTDFPNDYNGKVGIELRGSSSQWFAPKKPYSLELWDGNGLAVAASILGMPAESDWALIASYPDKTLMRSALTYRLGERIGRYAPRGQFVEVMLNGDYIGVYYLCERIKRDPNRVDISKLNAVDTLGDQLTGGYILKVDKLTGNSLNNWTSLYPPANNPGGNPVDIIVHYPKDTNLMPAQLDYIHGYVDSFELALNGPDFQDSVLGYRHFADMESFVDYFLMMEFVKSLDAFRSSCFFYKDRLSKGGKLTMGPLWDYDLSMGNGSFCDFWRTDGWAYQFNNVCPGDGWEVPFWWDRLLQDSVFSQRVRCRWEELKLTEYHLPTLFEWVDSVAAYLDEGQTRNYVTWPIMGTYVWPNYYIAADYQGEVDTLKWYLTERFAWLDANLPGVAGDCNLVGVSGGVMDDGYFLYPNPAAGMVKVRGGGGEVDGLVLRVWDLMGRMVYSGAVVGDGVVDLGLLGRGVYFYRVGGDGEMGGVRRLVLE